MSDIVGTAKLIPDQVGELSGLAEDEHGWGEGHPRQARLTALQAVGSGASLGLGILQRGLDVLQVVLGNVL